MNHKEIYTIGFTKKSLKEFIEILEKNKISKIVDVRLNNTSQLAGFSKFPDFEYLLQRCCNIKYEHVPILAPSNDILKKYKEDKDWKSYEESFNNLLKSRNLKSIIDKIYNSSENICLLCSEHKADKCHRRLVAEYIKQDNLEVVIKHI